MELAYGILELTPEQFWHYTPRDLEDLKHGFEARQDYYDNKWDTRFGHLIASLYNLAQPFFKGNKSWKPEQFILQWTKPKTPTVKQPVDRYNDMLYLKQMFGAK